MSNLFRGRFEIKLDPKGRLSLPAAFRAILPQEPCQIVVTNSRYKNKSCLHGYTLPEWQNLEKRISKLSQMRSEVQAFNRFYLSGGQVIDVDAQSRVLVPQSLRKFADLGLQVVMVGMGDKFEIWSQDSWTSIYESLTDSFENTMSAIAELDLGEET